MKYRALSRHEWVLNCPFLHAYRSDTLLKRFVTETQLIKCDLSHENLHYHGYPFACLKLPFTCRLASAHDWSDAIWMGWVICSEKNFSRSNGCNCLFRKKPSSVQTAEVFRSEKKSFVSTAKAICWKNSLPLELLRLSVRKKGQLFKQLQCHPFDRNCQWVVWMGIMLLIGKQYSAVWMTAFSVHMKLMSCSIGQVIIRQDSRANGWDYAFRRNFRQLPWCLGLFKMFNLSDLNGHVCPFWKKKYRIYI